MITFLAIVHIIACLGLIGLVLIQDSKGGGVFTTQASSGSILGASGATSLAQTMTKVVAAVFAVTCIGLAIMSSKSEKSVVDSVLPAATNVTTPAANDTAPAGNPTPTTNEKK